MAGCSTRLETGLPDPSEKIMEILVGYIRPEVEFRASKSQNILLDVYIHKAKTKG